MPLDPLNGCVISSYDDETVLRLLAQPVVAFMDRLCPLNLNRRSTGCQPDHKHGDVGGVDPRNSARLAEIERTDTVQLFLCL